MAKLKKRYVASFKDPVVPEVTALVAATGFGAFKSQTGIGFWVSQTDSKRAYKITSISEDPGVTKWYITDAVIVQRWEEV